MNTPKYTGMPLAERLTQAGLLQAFSKALREKDEAEMLVLLSKVELTEGQARDTVKSLLLDPDSHQNFTPKSRA